MIARALLATINADHPQAGMLAGFRTVFGASNVRDFDYMAARRAGLALDKVNRMFVEDCCRHRPDWIWLQVQETGVLTPEAIAEVRRRLPGAVVTHWMGDCRAAVPPYLASICRVTHLTLVSNDGQMGMFKVAGAQKALYCQIAVDWDEDVLGLPPWEPPFRVPDVVFCGNNYGRAFPGTPDREGAILALRAAKIDAGVVGGGWSRPFNPVGTCGVKQQHHVYRRAKVALSISHFNDIRLYYSDRQLISMASGTPVVCRHVPGLEDEFKDGVECLWYRTSQELVAHVRSLLADPRRAVAIGAAGRDAVIRDHTWEARIRQILPSVEGAIPVGG